MRNLLLGEYRCARGYKILLQKKRDRFFPIILDDRCKLKRSYHFGGCKYLEVMVSEDVFVDGLFELEASLTMGARVNRLFLGENLEIERRRIDIQDIFPLGAKFWGDVVSEVYRFNNPEAERMTHLFITGYYAPRGSIPAIVMNRIMGEVFEFWIFMVLQDLVQLGLVVKRHETKLIYQTDKDTAFLFRKNSIFGIPDIEIEDPNGKKLLIEAKISVGKNNLRQLERYRTINQNIVLISLQKIGSQIKRELEKICLLIIDNIENEKISKTKELILKTIKEIIQKI